MRDVFAGATAQPMVPDLLRLCKAWPPDVIVRDPQEFGGCVAAECLGIPHATGRENRFLSPRQWQQFTEPALHDLRRAHGLPPDPEMAMLYRYLAFAWAPRSFIEACGSLSPDVPFGTFIAPVMHFLRPVPFESSGDEALPGWIEQFPEQPTVYATLGTVFNQHPEVFRAIIEGLRDEAINLIVTVGRDQDPAQFGPQPPHVHIERYIPQSLLSPYCDVVITAGGFGTVMACLSAALPMVVVPLGADQPLNARRCAALGVGRAIAPDERTPAAIRDAVREVLASDSCRREAERLRQQMQGLPGLEHGVALLERLARDRKPQD
jgi:MGT family glycosyltransferase